MKEIEVKAKAANLAVIKDKLIAMGCSFSDLLVQKDRIYLHDSIKFTEIKTGTVVVRLRDVNGKCILTAKKRLENELAKLEKESVVGDAAQVNDIINLLDFKEVVQVNKKRQQCKYKDYTICLDEVENLGSYIEIEKMTKDEDSLKVQEELADFLFQLGVNKEDRVTMGYDTLIYNKLNP